MAWSEAARAAAAEARKRVPKTALQLGQYRRSIGYLMLERARRQQPGFAVEVRANLKRQEQKAIDTARKLARSRALMAKRK